MKIASRSTCFCLNYLRSLFLKESKEKHLSSLHPKVTALFPWQPEVAFTRHFWQLKNHTHDRRAEHTAHTQNCYIHIPLDSKPCEENKQHSGVAFHSKGDWQSRGLVMILTGSPNWKFPASSHYTLDWQLLGWWTGKEKVSIPVLQNRVPLLLWMCKSP